jgi:hypothetical protein
VFKLSEVLRVNEDNEIVPSVERVIPYDMWIELANCLGHLPTTEQQAQFFRQRNGTELARVEEIK